MAEPRTDHLSLDGDGARTDGDRTIGQLVAQASQDVAALVRAEIALAKAEIKQDVTHGAVGGALFAAAAVLAVLAGIMICIAAAYGLVALGLPPWAAFLVVAAAFLLVAALLVLVGRSRMRRVGPPERAIRAAQQTLAAVRPSDPA